MEIKNPCVEILCNMEVMNFVKSITQKKDTKKKSGLRNLATITYETLQYLEELPCAYQTSENIKSFLKEMSVYKLSKVELYNFVNEPPRSPLHIQLIVDDSDERLSEGQYEEILTLVRRYLIDESKEKKPIN